MKPLVIYVDGERDEIKLSRKQFEKFIQDAYQQGYDTGYAEGSKRYYWSPYYYTTTNTPNINPNQWTVTTSTKDPNTYDNNITGEVHNTIGD